MPSPRSASVARKTNTKVGLVTGPGSLDWQPMSSDLIAAPVAAALGGWPRAGDVAVAPIDPDLADTAAFCERYGVLLEDSANCVVIAGRRGETVSYAACVVLATTRADVNGVVRRRLGAKKASFAPMDDAVSLSAMEYGGITPIGLPAGWPVLIDRAVLDRDVVVIGSGLRRSKIALPSAALAELPGAEVIDGLAA
jgi:prolyl-tRNA editing enzyme YbaK/EbsC (Cys-tRNA(Pro) deacylase)